MAYNTGNAIGSADARDLYDNAQNLDKAMNSTDPTWIDRFGVARPTFKGAESELNQKVGDAEAAATEARGYLNTMRATSYGPLTEDPTTDPLGNPCTSGDEYFNTTYNLLKRFDGSIWRVPDINTENLASGAGSSLVGHGGQTVEAALNERLPEIGNYAGLDAYTGDATAVLIYGVSNIFDGGAGVFRRTTDTPAAANGIYRQDALGRWWKRDFTVDVDARWFGAIGNGVSSPLSTRYTSLASAQAAYPFAVALTEEIDRCACQAAVNYLIAIGGGTLNLNGRRYYFESQVTIGTSSDVTVRNGEVYWTGGGTNAFKLDGTLHRPTFAGLKIYGSGSPSLTQGAIGCASGVVTHDWLVDACEFNGVPFGVYINSDTAGTHYNPAVRFSAFKNAPRNTDDSSGAGLGLVFAEGGTGRIVNGVSMGNTFESCGRHGLYISDGGNVRSIGDRFLRHRDDGIALVEELAALQISRNAKNVTVAFPVFEGCVDTCLTVSPVLTAGVATTTENVTVINPVFRANRGRLIRIGSDSPSVNGTIKGLRIRDIEIYSSGETSSAAIVYLSGLDVEIDGVTVNEGAGANAIAQLVRLYGYGTTSESNRVAVKNVAGTMQGGSSSGVYVGTLVCTGTAKYTIDNVTVGATSVNYQATVTNTAIQVGRVDVIVADSPRANADPNGVYTAPPGTLFISKQGTARTLWIKETLSSSSGWVPVKTRQIAKSTTANRPALGNNSYDIGTQHMDTTLNANGKPIWWNGTAWVDATGATV